jgi:FtsZ-binding cell division protein ZapB
MEPTIIIAVIGVLAAPIAAVITWLLNRKKNVAEIYSALSESSQTAVETMQLTMNELRIELEESRKKIDLLIKENEMLRTDLRSLKQQNNQLMIQMNELRSFYGKSQQHDN